MFELSLDAWHAWLGVAAASVVVFGVALGLPSAAPPAAAPAADTVDEVATSPYEAQATVELRADAYRVDSHRLSLRTDGGTSHATLAYGPVTPADDTALERVLDGASPSTVFASQTEFERAVDSAQARDGEWRSAPETLVIRRVTWGDVDATLVG